jgi:hypothetical protein
MVIKYINNKITVCNPSLFIRMLIVALHVLAISDAILDAKEIYPVQNILVYNLYLGSRMLAFQLKVSNV